MQSILIIGGGNMGSALALRWREAFADASLTVVDPNTAKRSALVKRGITCAAALTAYRDLPDVVVLCVKPQQAAAVLAHLRKKRAQFRSSLLVSVMAGVKLAALTGSSEMVARAMPNTPVHLGEGMSVLCAPGLAAKPRTTLTRLFSAAGKVAWVEQEKELHAVTAISGSGPAYVFAFMEALQEAAESLGLARDIARTLVTQTVRGAALLADAHAGDVATLRRNVTSPNGTTQAALKQFKKGKLTPLVTRAARAAKKRSKQLSSQ